MVHLRPESEYDHLCVKRVIEEAFASTEWGHQGESELVAELRAEPGVLSLVAEEAGEIRGHILLSPASIESPRETTRGLALAPMAVLPEHQGRGVGSALVEAGLSLARASGAAFVIVFGHADYYPRFGFVPAADVGVVHALEGLPAEPFFVLPFDPGTGTRIAGGIARYLPAFGPQG